MITPLSFLQHYVFRGERGRWNYFRVPLLWMGLLTPERRTRIESLISSAPSSTPLQLLPLGTFILQNERDPSHYLIPCARRCWDRTQFDLFLPFTSGQELSLGSPNVHQFQSRVLRELSKLNLLPWQWLPRYPLKFSCFDPGPILRTGLSSSCESSSGLVRLGKGV